MHIELTVVYQNLLYGIVIHIEQRFLIHVLKQFLLWREEHGTANSVNECPEGMHISTANIRNPYLCEVKCATEATA